MMLRGLALQLYVNLTGAFGFILFGYDQGVMGGMLSLETFQKCFDYPSSTMQGFLVASYDLGCLLGAIACFWLGQIPGRKGCLYIACSIVIVGASLQASSFSRSQFIVGRIVAGTGVGAISATVPMYVAETCNTSRRGPMVVLQNAIIVTGIITSSFTNFGLVFQSPGLEGKESQWRIALALQVIFPIIVLFMLPLCPESPRWKAYKGATVEEVASILAQLDGKTTTPDEPHIRSQAMSIVNVANHEAELEVSWKEAFGGGELQNGRRLFLSGFVVGLIQQICGINAIVYYAPTVFQQIGLSPRMSFILSGVGSVSMFVGSVLPAFFIERVGRRKTLLFSTWAVAISMGGIAASIGWGINHPEDKTAAGWAGTGFILVYEFVYGMGVAPICYIFASEVNSLRARHKGHAVQAMSLWGGCFLVVMVSPVGFSNISWYYYLIWMFCTLIWIPMIWALMPETTGRSLEEVDYFFKKFQHQWYIRNVAYNWGVPDGDVGDEIKISEDTVNVVQVEDNKA